MDTGTLRYRSAMLVASLVLVLPWSSASCAPRSPSPTPASYPAIGTVERLDGGRVGATGVVGQYPVTGRGRTFVDWVVWGRLGSRMTSPQAIGSLLPRQGAAYSSYDGKLVTIEGTLSPPRGGYGPPHSPWSRLEVDSISLAPPEAQARIPWTGSLVQPGRWFDTPWRLTLVRVFQELEAGPNYPNVAQASKAFGAPIPAPRSPRAGRLMGIVLATFDNDTRPREWYQFYSTGVMISGPFSTSLTSERWIASQLKSARDSHDRVRRILVNGQPGLVTGIGQPSQSLWYWNGDGGVLVTPLSRDVDIGLGQNDLLAIARSMAP